MVLEDKLRAYRTRVESALDHWLPAGESKPASLHGAMRYAVLGDGKRIRPCLVYASGEAFGVSGEELDGPAVAVEMIHAYSLIHDDLPAMDDDDLRRGRPTCHKAFDEATAILAGDAIQALAFHVIASDPAITVDAEQRLDMINRLAVASGSTGMAGGQAIDLAAVGQDLNIEQLEDMHRYKTGALIRASVELGALSSRECTAEGLQRVAEFADYIGLAFQVQDDILDIEGETEVLGKPQGSDHRHNKPTYTHLLGMEGAKRAARALQEQALESLAGFDASADTLRQIARFIVDRRK